MARPRDRRRPATKPTRCARASPQLEREQHERTARANAALAAAQDRTYWLDRWHVDLNALMRRPVAGGSRAALRAAARASTAALDGAGALLGTLRERTLAGHRGGAGALGDAAAARSGARSRRAAAKRAVTELLSARLSAERVEAIERAARPGEARATRYRGRRSTGAARARVRRPPRAARRVDAAACAPTCRPPSVHAMGRDPRPQAARLLRRPRRRTRSGAAGSTLDAGQTRARLRLLVGPRGAGARRGVPGHRLARLRPDPRGDRLGARAPARDRVRAQPGGPAAARTRTAIRLVFAISIWTHFAERRGARLAARDAPHCQAGGRLCSRRTASRRSRTAAARDSRRRAARGVERRSYESGFWYANEFGEAGDHGVANPDWGTAFLSPEWLLARLTPDWESLIPPRARGGEPGPLRARAPLAVTSVSVVIPVKDGGRYSSRVLHAIQAQGDVELLVIDSGSRDRSLEIARAAGGRAARDRARGVRARPDAEPGRRAHFGRADLLPDPGRRTRDGLARRLPRGVRARPARGRRLWPAPSPSRHEPDDRARAQDFFEGFAPSGEPTLQRPGDLTVPLERERVLLRARAGRSSGSPTWPTPRTRPSAARCSRPAG